ncbi:helix-turn-helix domain-containing protein [Sulfoacidibacillus thermotolerans]|uniref:HTH cro/C1-type domain-containing protein n=1 Tax=Sulfoacidibacillus thermotolerans TaxID=1765684 RepID=A0A2U3D5Q3_SULT2|nr:XRE family transcriptional regulator [Sulfoacidibacillus thermotolerans]PWI56578.1 hypothetical protein BM613_12960 [Sulfoacidibacillus thermotolerans]
MFSFDLIAKNIDRIRDDQGVTIEELARIVGVTRPTMYKYLRGEQPIDSAKLTKFCEALGVTMRQLVEDEPDIFAFLFRADNPKKNFTRETQHLLIEHLDEYWSVIEAVGEDRVVMLPPSYRLEGKLDDVMKAQIRDIADRTRNALGVDGYVGKLIFQVLEDWHIHILAYQFGREIDALSAYTQKRGAFIVVNDDAAIPEERKIFSVAHELGHLLLHRDQYRQNGEAYAKARGNHEERMANFFASYFLIPRAHLNECVTVLHRSQNKLRDILQLKREFGVSAQALILALHNENVLSRTEYGYLKKQLESRFGNNEPNPMPYVEKNIRAKALLRRFHADECISISKVVSVLGISHEDANKLLAEWEREDDISHAF